MVEQHTSPPESIWQVVWPILAPALTPGMVTGMLLTIALTHTAKVVTAAIAPSTYSTAARWRAYCSLLSIIVGTVVGFAVHAVTDTGWLVIVICALGSGPVWRLTQALLPARVADTLVTETDRMVRNEKQACDET